MRNATPEPIARCDLRIFVDRSDVSCSSMALEYLLHNQRLIPVLQRAVDDLLCYFPDSQVSLDLANLQDTSHQTILLKLETDLRTNEALKKLDLFDEGWWKAASYLVRNQVCIDIKCTSMTV